MKTKKRLIGDNGEKIACQFLKKNYYLIFTSNYATKYGEIDIIAIETKKSRKMTEEYKIMPKVIRDEDVLVFVEVKTRKSNLFGQPSEAVDNKKIKNYESVASEFIKTKTDGTMQYRYDIIEILDGKINHIKNAF